MDADGNTLYITGGWHLISLKDKHLQHRVGMNTDVLAISPVSFNINDAAYYGMSLILHRRWAVKRVRTVKGF